MGFSVKNLKVGLPAIDFVSVLQAANGNNEERKMPISVSIYVDDSAQSDIMGHVRSLFASAAENARITLSYLGTAQAVPNPGDDAAVIIAGFHNEVGRLAHDLREAGVPVMVVTTMPSIVAQVAGENGFNIPRDDLVSPEVAEDAEEPFVLGEEDIEALNNRMGEWIIAVSGEKRLAFAAAFPFVCRPLSLSAVSITSIENAIVGAMVFVPGASMPVMTVNQMKMLLQIAAAYGQPMGPERVKELAVVFAGGLGFRSVSRTLSGLIPILGPVFKMGIGYGGTQVMGRAAIEYFENGGGVVGLGKLVAEASGVAVKAVGTVQAAVSGEQPEPEPEPEKDWKERVVDSAQLWGGRATKVGSTAAKIAKPLAQGVAESGAESLKRSAKSLLHLK